MPAFSLSACFFMLALYMASRERTFLTWLAGAISSAIALILLGAGFFWETHR
jgi:hypothetical protein